MDKTVFDLDKGKTISFSIFLAFNKLKNGFPPVAVENVK